ncbi:MAG: hypothetical protein IT376_10780 [Polyangiaceae bacterium]|nr:hypothetical protein [Polyangiaceae bacterium]
MAAVKVLDGPATIDLVVRQRGLAQAGKAGHRYVVTARPLMGEAEVQLTPVGAPLDFQSESISLRVSKEALPTGQFELTVRLGGSESSVILARDAAGTVRPVDQRSREDLVWGDGYVGYAGPSGMRVEEEK